jgi:hypothetical protein
MLDPLAKATNCLWVTWSNQLVANWLLRDPYRRLIDKVVNKVGREEVWYDAVGIHSV